MEEFCNLLRETANQFTPQFAAARSEIGRVQSLLGEAIDNLTQSFQGMQAAVKQADQAIQGMTSQGMTFALESQQNIDGITRIMEWQNLSHRKAVAALGDSAATAETLVGRAITALQFQDMVSQLLAHILRRVNALDGVIRQFNVLGADLQRKAASDNIPDAIASLRAEQGKIAAALRGVEAQTINNPVDQKAMTDGDIELF